MSRYETTRRGLIALGATIVLIRCLIALPHEFTSDEQRSFAAALLEFNPYGHQPPPPAYPVYVAAGKFLHFFVRQPLATLLILSVASAVIGFVLYALAFSELIGLLGVAGALAVYLSPPVKFLCTHPTPEPLAFALFAAAVWFWLRGSHWCGVFAGLAIGARPQMIAAVLAFVLATRATRSLATLGMTLVAAFIPIIRNVGWDRWGTYVASTKWIGPGAPLHEFLVQPWSKATLVVYALAIIGLVAVIYTRTWRALPLAAFSIAHVAFVLTTGANNESVRPFVPALIGIAFLAVSSVRWRSLRSPS